MKTTMKFSGMGLVILALAFTSCSKDGEIGPMGPAGPQGEQGIQGPAGQDGTAPFSIYTESPRLNSNFAGPTVTSDYTPLPFSYTFNKEMEDSLLEVFFNSRIYSGTFQNGTLGVTFDITVDGNLGELGGSGSIQETKTSEFISLFNIFQNLAAGEHTIQIVAKTSSISDVGTSESVRLDPGGWDGRIITKETF